MKHAKILVGCLAILFAAMPTEASLIWAVDNLGEFHGGTVGDRIIRFDSATPGAVTVVGDTGAEDILMTGLDFDATGTLYSYGWDSFGTQRGLFTINQSSGAATLVGAGGVSPNYFIDDLSYDPSTNTLYAVANYFFNVRPCQLYTINMSSGAASLVGDIAGTIGASCIGLATNSAGVRYLHDTVGDRMFSLSGLTASPMLMPEGFDSLYSQGMTIDRSSGVWYHGALNNTTQRSELWTVNPVNGAGTLVGNIGGFNSGSGFTEFETGDIAIFPEPATGVLLLLALAGLSRRPKR